MSTNILFVSHSSELAGAELMLLQTLEHTDKKRLKPICVLPGVGPFKDEADRIGLETEIVPMKWWLSERGKVWKQPVSWLWNIKSIFTISRIIQDRNISLVFSNSAVAFSGALAARIKGIPHIWAVHEILHGKKPFLFFLFGNRLLARIIYNLSSRIIVNSRATQQVFQQQAKVLVVHNGLEVKPLESFSRLALRKELGLEEDDIVLAVLGKIFKEKGQREVTLAMASLLEKYTSLKLLVIGAVHNRRYFNKLQRIIEKYSLEKAVIFTGFRKDVLKLLKAVDVLVVASSIESFGRSIIEAMAVGTPVLAVKSGGIKEIITEGKNGFLVESRDADSIRVGLDAILADPLKRSQASKEGILTVAERFSLKDKVEMIKDAVDNCLKE